jgi:hypothetical protein
MEQVLIGDKQEPTFNVEHSENKSFSFFDSIEEVIWWVAISLIAGMLLALAIPTSILPQ